MLDHVEHPPMRDTQRAPYFVTPQLAKAISCAHIVHHPEPSAGDLPDLPAAEDGSQTGHDVA